MIPSQHDQKLRELMHVFLAENAKINLTALRTEEACWIGNIEDSLAFLDLPFAANLQAQSKLIDLGTGGGFPLLPLAITLPQVRCVGLDTIKKKVDAVSRIAKELKLENAMTIAERTEVLGRDVKHREKYDVVTSRAVAPLNVLLEYCSPFAKVNGQIVVWKSMHIDEELAASANAQKMLGCALTSTHEYTLPGDFGTRQLLIFTKTKTLPMEYPRKVGIPKQQPLC